MSYTLLSISEAGVALWSYHTRRLALEADSAARERWLALGREGAPGVWAVWTDDAQGLRTEPRPGSRLHHGMPSRTRPSPIAGLAGPIPKPAPPGIYDRVRRAGTATLLLSEDGTEILEACCAAVVSWDGDQIVCVPRNRPRVWSTAEAAIRDHLPTREAIIPAGSDALLLVNAVKGTCALADPRSRGFPPRVRLEIEELFARLSFRPGRE